MGRGRGEEHDKIKFLAMVGEGERNIMYRGGCGHSGWVYHTVVHSMMRWCVQDQLQWSKVVDYLHTEIKTVIYCTIYCGLILLILWTPHHP